MTLVVLIASSAAMLATGALAVLGILAAFPNRKLVDNVASALCVAVVVCTVAVMLSLLWTARFSAGG